MKDWDKIVVAIKKLEVALDDLLQEVRERYLEINLDETNQAAWDASLAFQDRFAKTILKKKSRKPKSR